MQVQAGNKQSAGGVDRTAWSSSSSTHCCRHGHPFTSRAGMLCLQSYAHQRLLRHPLQLQHVVACRGIWRCKVHTSHHAGRAGGNATGHAGKAASLLLAGLHQMPPTCTHKLSRSNRIIQPQPTQDRSPTDLPSRVHSSTAPPVVSKSIRSACCCCWPAAEGSGAPATTAAAAPAAARSLSRGRRLRLRLLLRRRSRERLRLRSRRSRLLLRRRSLLRLRRRSRDRSRLRDRRRSRRSLLRLRSRRSLAPRSSRPSLPSRPPAAGAATAAAAAACALSAGAASPPAGMKVTLTERSAAASSGLTSTAAASAPWKPLNASMLLLQYNMGRGQGAQGWWAGQGKASELVVLLLPGD